MASQSVHGYSVCLLGNLREKAGGGATICCRLCGRYMPAQCGQYTRLGLPLPPSLKASRLFTAACCPPVGGSRGVLCTEHRLQFDSSVREKAQRLVSPYLRRHMDSESPLSSLLFFFFCHGFRIHSNHHISPMGFTRFVRCDSKADISSHAAISKF